MTDKFEIGYGKPPEASRFKPGQSGNPKGRPKRAAIYSELEAELSATIYMRDGDQELEISKRRALIKALIAKAIRGDTRAALAVIELSAKFDSDSGDAGAATGLPTVLQPLLDILVDDEIRKREQAKKPPPSTENHSPDHHLSRETSSHD